MLVSGTTKIHYPLPCAHVASVRSTLPVKKDTDKAIWSSSFESWRGRSLFFKKKIALSSS